MTDFAALFYRLLPGIYRTKDPSGELQQFLAIAAQPCSEIEQSIAQLAVDLFVDSCRPEFLPLIGDLIRAQLDAGDPASIQRTTLATTFAFYRSKGLADPLARTVQAVSGWSTVPVDFSQVVARLPFVETLQVVLRRRALTPAEDPPGSGQFHFNATKAITPLYDEARGRAIRRDEVTTLAAEVVGTDAGFGIYNRGIALVGPRAPAPLAVLGADLTDFAHPKDAGGAALAIAANQVAVDPQLGRFLFASPSPFLAGNVTVDYHELVPGATRPETFDIRDSSRMALLGRSDDPAPYTLDFRSPATPSDTRGRTFYDNHGFYLTVGVTMANQRPNLLVSGAFSGFSFDNRPLAQGNTTGNFLQLQDGIDGQPLTRARLAGNESAFVDQPRGFTLRDLATSLRDRPTPARIRAADLSDFANPKDAAGAALVLANTDVAVDPQLGRFLLNTGALALPAARIRVGYLIAPAVRSTGATPFALGGAVYAFGSNAEANPLRDAYDGTPLSIKLRLGANISDFHGTDRGYRVFRNGTDVSGALAPELKPLDSATATATAGKLAIDLDRGRFAFPASYLQPADVVTVELTSEDRVATGRTFERVAQRMPRMMPAGVVPVLIDTRRSRPDPATLAWTGNPS